MEREAVIKHHTQFLQCAYVQKGGKGLAEENPGQQDYEQEAGVGVTVIKSLILQLFPGSQTALCIYLGVSKLLHVVVNTQSEVSKIQSLSPYHNSSPSQC